MLRVLLIASFLLLQTPTSTPIPAADGFYPERGLRMEKSGKVMLECRNGPAGTVNRCTVIEETPAGYGFGEAALRMSAKFVVATVLPDGSEIVEGSVIRIPVTFELK